MLHRELLYITLVVVSHYHQMVDWWWKSYVRTIPLEHAVE